MSEFSEDQIEAAAKAMARAENSYMGSMVVNYGGTGSSEQWLHVTSRHFTLARAALEAVQPTEPIVSIVSLFENDEQHCLAYLGQTFRNASEDAESDGCDEYWWRTAGLKAVLKEIERRAAVKAAQETEL